LQRAKQLFSALNQRDQGAVSTLLESCGLGALLGVSLNRDIERAGNLERWSRHTGD